MWTQEKYELACAIDRTRQELPKVWSTTWARIPLLHKWRAASLAPPASQHMLEPPRALPAGRSICWIATALAAAGIAGLLWKRIRLRHSP